MASWHLAPSLAQLRDEVDARWPRRSKASDGTVGDAAHAARPSEHNPDNDPDPMPTGAVSAIDITSTNSELREAVLKAAIGDRRVWYVINQGRIWSRTHGWREREYTGSNPHSKHIHISLVQTKAAHDDVSVWGITKTDPTPAANKPPSQPKPAAKIPPTVRRGSKGPNVRALQGFLGVKGPGLGTFGPRTQRAVRRYQRRQGLVVDGIVGPKTWGRILTALKLPGYND